METLNQHPEIATGTTSADALGSIAIAASLRFGNEVLALERVGSERVFSTDSTGSSEIIRQSVPIDVNSTRDFVLQGQAREIMRSGKPELSLEFMKERRASLLEFWGMSRERQAELEPFFERFELQTGYHPRDSLVHLLLGDLELENLEVHAGGAHYVPETGKEIIPPNRRRLIVDRTRKDVKGLPRERGVTKRTEEIDGFIKSVATIFPEGSTIEEVMRWIQTADNDRTAPLIRSEDQATGKLRGYVKETVDPSPGGLDMRLVLTPEGKIHTAFPRDKVKVDK